MAEKQKVLLSEMFGSLQSSIEAIRTLMSLFLVEFIGYETFATFVISWLVILFLPQFGLSRFKLHLVLFADLFLEIVIRRLYGYFVLGGAAKSPPDSLVSSSMYYVYIHVYSSSFSDLYTVDLASLPRFVFTILHRSGRRQKVVNNSSRE